MGLVNEYGRKECEATRVCPALLESRQAPRWAAPNAAGRCLLDLVAENECVLTTGRGKGDVGQHTSEGGFGRGSLVGGNKTEHLVVSPNCYCALVSVGVQDLVDVSDHRPLSALFLYAGTRH